MYNGEDAVDLTEPPAGLEAPQLYFAPKSNLCLLVGKKAFSEEAIEGATEMTKCRVCLEVTSDNPYEDQS